MYIFCCFCIFLHKRPFDHNSDHLFSRSNLAVTSFVTAISLYINCFTLYIKHFLIDNQHPLPMHTLLERLLPFYLLPLSLISWLRGHRCS